MTEQSEATASAPSPGPNWHRMAKVWGLLAASMTVGALACWWSMASSMPAALPAAPADHPLPNVENLADLLWPDELAPERDWRYLVIHHSATPSATVDAIRQYHTGIGFEGVGYHFVINNGRAPGTEDGRITPTRRWLEQRSGAHARIGSHPEYNSKGIGICLVGNFEKEPPTAAQMASLEMLVLALRRRYSIGLEEIVGHGELKNTKCPGRFFPMESFLMDVRQAGIRRHLRSGAGP